MDDAVILPDLPTYLFTPTLGSVLSWVLTFVLPLAAAYLMKRSWSSPVKGTVLLVLAAVKSYVEAWIAADSANVAFNHVTTLYALALNFGIAVVSYFGYWRGSTVQQSALDSGVSDGRADPARR